MIPIILKKWILTALAFLIILTTAVGALSVVWMRQQISKSAYRCQALEVEFRNIDTKKNILASKIAQVHNPEFLKTYAQINLQTPDKNKIIWAKMPKKNDILCLPRHNNSVVIAFHNYTASDNLH